MLMASLYLKKVFSLVQTAKNNPRDTLSAKVDFFQKELDANDSTLWNLQQTQVDETFFIEKMKGSLSAVVSVLEDSTRDTFTEI